jgi:hypothetical protein
MLPRPVLFTASERPGDAILVTVLEELPLTRLRTIL